MGFFEWLSGAYNTITGGQQQQQTQPAPSTTTVTATAPVQQEQTSSTPALSPQPNYTGYNTPATQAMVQARTEEIGRQYAQGNITQEQAAQQIGEISRQYGYTVSSVHAGVVAGSQKEIASPTIDPNALYRVQYAPQPGTVTAGADFSRAAFVRGVALVPPALTPETTRFQTGAGSVYTEKTQSVFPKEGRYTYLGPYEVSQHGEKVQGWLYRSEKGAYFVALPQKTAGQEVPMSGGPAAYGGMISSGRLTIEPLVPQVLRENRVVSITSTKTGATISPAATALPVAPPDKTLPRPFTSVGKSTPSEQPGQREFQIGDVPALIAGNIQKVTFGIVRADAPPRHVGMVQGMPSESTVPNLNIESRGAALQYRAEVLLPQQDAALTALAAGNVTAGTWTGTEAGYKTYSAMLETRNREAAQLNADIGYYEKDVQKVSAARVASMTKWEQWEVGAKGWLERKTGTTAMEQRELAFRDFSNKDATGYITGFGRGVAAGVLARPGELIVIGEQGAMLAPLFGAGTSAAAAGIGRISPAAAPVFTKAVPYVFGGGFLAVGGFVDTPTGQMKMPGSAGEYVLNFAGATPELAAFTAGAYSIPAARYIGRMGVAASEGARNFGVRSYNAVTMEGSVRARTYGWENYNVFDATLRTPAGTQRGIGVTMGRGNTLGWKGSVIPEPAGTGAARGPEPFYGRFNAETVYRTDATRYAGMEAAFTGSGRPLLETTKMPGPITEPISLRMRTSTSMGASGEFTAIGGKQAGMMRFGGREISYGESARGTFFAENTIWEQSRLTPQRQTVEAIATFQGGKLFSSERVVGRVGGVPAAKTATLRTFYTETPGGYVSTSERIQGGRFTVDRVFVRDLSVPYVEPQGMEAKPMFRPQELMIGESSVAKNSMFEALSGTDVAKIVRTGGGKGLYEREFIPAGKKTIGIDRYIMQDFDQAAGDFLTDPSSIIEGKYQPATKVKISPASESEVLPQWLTKQHQYLPTVEYMRTGSARAGTTDRLAKMQAERDAKWNKWREEKGFAPSGGETILVSDERLMQDRARSNEMFSAMRTKNKQFTDFDIVSGMDSPVAQKIYDRGYLWSAKDITKGSAVEGMREFRPATVDTGKPTGSSRAGMRAISIGGMVFGYGYDYASAQTPMQRKFAEIGREPESSLPPTYRYDYDKFQKPLPGERERTRRGILPILSPEQDRRRDIGLIPDLERITEPDQMTRVEERQDIIPILPEPTIPDEPPPFEPAKPTPPVYPPIIGGFPTGAGSGGYSRMAGISSRAYTNPVGADIIMAKSKGRKLPVMRVPKQMKMRLPRKFR